VTSAFGGQRSIQLPDFVLVARKRAQLREFKCNQLVVRSDSIRRSRPGQEDARILPTMFGFVVTRV
jgi:hypothetical protein